MSSREIQVFLEEHYIRMPSLSTIRAHLHALIQMGTVIRTRAKYGNPRYYRLVDSVFEGFPDALAVPAC